MDCRNICLQGERPIIHFKAFAFILSQAAKNQQNIDDDSRQLAEELSIMLAYSAACHRLTPVEGRESIVVRAVRLTQEGACIIDECMAHSFIGESSGSSHNPHLTFRESTCGGGTARWHQE